MTTDSLVPVAATVGGVVRENHDTWTFHLAPEHPLGPIAPGQFVMAGLPGVGEAPISVSAMAGDHFALTFRVVGSVTSAMAAAGAGATIGVRGPFGTPWPIERARGGDLLVVAGGIGLAPLRSVIAEAIATRHTFGSVSVVYGARTPADLVFGDALTEWRSRLDLDVEVTVDVGPSGWHGAVGLVTRLLPRMAFDPAATTALVCGPEIMMQATARALTTMGLDPESVFVTMERRMWCAIGGCGHCQFGPVFVCRDGPVFPWPEVAASMSVAEL